MKNFLTISILICFNFFSEAQWVAQTSGTTQNLQCVFFIDKDTGYAAGDGVTTATLLKSTNGGITWTSLTNPSIYSIRAIWFFTADTGYFINNNTQLYYTTNGGNAWTYKRNLGFYTSGNPNFGKNSLRFVNRNLGFFYSPTSRIYRTQDGGINWDSSTSFSYQYSGGFSFISSNIGYMALGNGTVSKTINGGGTWSSVTQPTTNYLNDVKFLNSNLGFVVGTLSNNIIKTTDGGSTWSAMSIGLTVGTSYKLIFTSANKVFMLNSSTITISNDSCNTWTSMGIYPSASFNDFFMVNDSIGYAVGGSGIIYKTYPGAVAPPTTASSSLYTSSITNTSMTVNWTSGNGARRMVIARATNNSMSNPTTGTSYTANSIFGSGNTVGSGNYVVYDGTGSSCNVTGLSLSTTYFFRVYDYNGTGTTTNYLTSSYASGGAATLPVKLIEFKARVLGENKVQLNWSTASEINNNYFEIERSNDGEHFENIGTVKGNGNSNKTINYNFTDENPMKGISYYRLKQTDFDGKSSLSEVRVVNLNKVLNNFTIYPNPNNGIMNVEIESAEQKNISINLFDVNGRNILNEKHIIESGKQTFQINTSKINSGIYFLNIVDENNSSISKQKLIVN